MKIIYPANRDMSNGFLQQHLMVKCSKEYEQGKPTDSYVLESVEKLFHVFDSQEPSRLVICSTKNVRAYNNVARWFSAAVPCTTNDFVSFVVSYAELVDAMKNDEAYDFYRNAPCLAIMYPELVQSAQWAIGKFYDILESRKKALLVFTTNVSDLKNAIGALNMDYLLSMEGFTI